MTASGRDSFRGEKILELDHGDGCTALNIIKTTELYF